MECPDSKRNGGDFEKRTVYSDPFEEPIFEAPWGEGSRPADATPRNIIGTVAVAALDADVLGSPSIEMSARIADNYPPVEA